MCAQVCAKNTHHFWWPRKKFPHKNFRKVQLSIPHDFHTTYHNHFLKVCRAVPDGRVCHNTTCVFESICCYCGTSDTF